MASPADDFGAGDESPAPSNRLGVPIARAEAFREFAALVQRLGGDPAALLERFPIDLPVLDDPNGLIPYRAMVRVLEHAAAELKCPDFGMQLAALQGPGKIVGPVGVAMRNSATLGDAFRYCAENVHVFSNVTEMSLEKLPDAGGVLLRFAITLDRLPNQRQAVEHSLSLVHRATPMISGGQVRVKEVWFTHEPLASLATYRAHLGGRVRFNQPVNGLLFNERDLDAVVPDRNRQLYALATSFIDQQFPRSRKTLTERVRGLISSLLKQGDCSQDRVADALGIHTRTLQRRLKDEGETFEGIKDAVRRDAVLLYLRQPIPLVQVAAALGYSELSTLSRSCTRWYSATPRRLRRELGRRESEMLARE
jgi:AraC-like DNA-binding protein